MLLYKGAQGRGLSSVHKQQLAPVSTFYFVLHSCSVYKTYQNPQNFSSHTRLVAPYTPPRNTLQDRLQSSDDAKDRDQGADGERKVPVQGDGAGGGDRRGGLGEADRGGEGPGGGGRQRRLRQADERAAQEGRVRAAHGGRRTQEGGEEAGGRRDRAPLPVALPPPGAGQCLRVPRPRVLHNVESLHAYGL